MKISPLEQSGTHSAPGISGAGHGPLLDRRVGDDLPAAVRDAVAPTAVAARTRSDAGPRERIFLLAMSMALVALGIDVLLPAFADVRADLGLAPDATAVAGLITAYFVGLAIGQLPAGLLADRFGRRPVLLASIALYVVGALVASVAPSLALLLVARLVWGIASSGPRVVAYAVIRDTFDGEAMSRAMSLLMAVFIAVPVVAPALGAAGVVVVGWRGLVVGCALAGVGMLAWARRLPETLHRDDRREIRIAPVMAAVRTAVGTRQTLAHTLALTALYGAFTSWLASSEIIIGETFGAASMFPFLFGGLAAVIGAAMVLNSRIVERVGTRRLSRLVMRGYLGASALLVVVTQLTDGVPPLWLFMGVMALVLAAHALLIPNFNSLAMQPMGHIAGTASALIGTFQIAVGAILGALLDQAYDGTVAPLAVGFLVSGVVASGLTRWANAEPGVAVATPAA